MQLPLFLTAALAAFTIALPAASPAAQRDGGKVSTLQARQRDGGEVSTLQARQRDGGEVSTLQARQRDGGEVSTLQTRQRDGGKVSTLQTRQRDGGKTSALQARWDDIGRAWSEGRNPSVDQRMLVTGGCVNILIGKANRAQFQTNVRCRFYRAGGCTSSSHIGGKEGAGLKGTNGVQVIEDFVSFTCWYG